MQTEEKQMKMSYLIKRFVPYFKKYKWILILDLICASLTTVCELVFPMLVRYITNMGINNIAGLTVGIILKIGLFYLILRIIDSAANFYSFNWNSTQRKVSNAGTYQNGTEEIRCQ